MQQATHEPLRCQQAQSSDSRCRHVPAMPATVGEVKRKGKLPKLPEENLHYWVLCRPLKRRNVTVQKAHGAMVKLPNWEGLLSLVKTETCQDDFARVRTSLGRCPQRCHPILGRRCRFSF